MAKCSTLYVSNFSKKLSDRDKEDLLKNFGAKSVRCMPSGCRYQGTAFATFGDADEAQQALHQLHQLDVLGRLLRVEFAKDFHAPYRPPELQEQPEHQSGLFARRKEPDACDAAEQADAADRLVELNHISESWSLSYPANPTLHYRYPAPTVTILTNIACALASVPRFYVQTLHLMNKMNLPAPFGFLSPAPYLVDDRSLYTEEMEERAMDISESSEESELEDDDATATSSKAASGRSLAAESNSQRRALRARRAAAPKRSRLLAQKEAAARRRPGPLKQQVDLSAIFDSAILQEQRKIAIKVGSCTLPPEVAKLPTQQMEQLLLQMTDGRAILPSSGCAETSNAASKASPRQEPASGIISSVSAADAAAVAHDTPTSARQPAPPAASLMLSAPSSAFGFELPIVDQPPRPADLLALLESGFVVMKNPPGDPSLAVPQSAAAAAACTPGSSGGSVSRSKQLTPSEMNDFPVFKNYAKGDPCARIYIKNLAKQITELDLRSLLAESFIEAKDIVDFRLMTEGRMKGQAFVTFTDTAVAARALEHTNGLVLHEKPIVVVFAKSAKSA